MPSQYIECRVDQIYSLGTRTLIRLAKTNKDNLNVIDERLR